jgi:single-strand DNA-binding protein
MNNCTFIGNLTRDPDIRSSKDGTTIASFTVAVQRRYKDKTTGKYESDFIRCTAFRASAELIQKYFKKGSRIGIQGTMHTDSYEKEGIKIPTCECWVDSIDFCNGPKKDEITAPKIDDGLDEFFDMKPLDEDELPF